MPFEDLKTDEKLATTVKAKPGMDDLMLSGCVGFGAASLAAYVLTSWPFIVFEDAEHLRTLIICSAMGPGVVLVGSLLVGHKAGLAGLCGWIGGTMAATLFLFLRLQSLFHDGFAGTGPLPEFGAIWVWALPLLVLALASTVAILAFVRASKTHPNR